MPHIKQENIGLLHDKISITLTTEDYMPVVDKSLKNLSKNISIPGFRKGLVPLGHVKKIYGQEVYSDEVMKLVSKTLENYLIENKADILGRPLLVENQERVNLDINQPKEYLFEFEIGNRPQLHIPLLDANTTMPVYKVIVTTDDIDKEVEYLQLTNSAQNPAEIVDNTEQLVNADVYNTNEEEAKKVTSISLLVKSYNTEMQSALLGKKVGDEIIFKPAHAFDTSVADKILKDNFKTESHEALHNDYRLHITDIFTLEKPKMDNSFFDNIFPGENIQDEGTFRDRILSDIQTQWNRHAQQYARTAIMDMLIEKTQIDFPEAYLKRFFSVGGEQYIPMQRVEKDFERNILALKRSLIEEFIVKKHQIDVSKDEMQTAAEMQIMSYFGARISLDTDFSWLKQFAKKELEKPEYADKVYREVLYEKIMYVLENTFTLQESDIHKDEFIALVKAQTEAMKKYNDHYHDHTHDHDHDHDHNHEHHHAH